ncbi:MAG TPA: FtsX-like permease family protein, partial [Candidatus Binatia bacterium]|nr:FtsX-like permease family protein [Candidatus Binatia bacterium]
MALRDARRGVKTMLLSMSCVVLGVAAVVAAFSFRDNLQSSIRAQSKSLLGADLAIESRGPFSAEAEALVASIGGAQSRQIGFSSMAYFPDSGKSRLVQVRAIGRDFPYYGALETEPTSAAKELQAGPNALVDETVMLQFNARIGERLKIGEQDFRIAGKLRKIPGETLAFSLLSPRIYVPIAYLDQTQLMEKGSLVRYRAYFKLDTGVDVDQLVQRMSPQLARLRLEADTVTRRLATISRTVENLSRYLQLAVFIAVLLAGVGVASGIHVYTKEKTPSMAMLRCIGAGAGATVFVYVIQSFVIALVGSIIGAILGAGFQVLLPLALEDFLPVKTVVSFAPKGVLVGMAIGLGTTLLFSLIPLVPLRNISPLLALRSSYETDRRTRDPILSLIFLLIVATVFGFGLATTEHWTYGVFFAGTVLGVFGLIAILARAISTLTRKLIPASLPYPWRQGLANLHRPKNQTTAVMLSIGLGTFLLITLYSVQSMLVNQVVARSGQGEPNLVLFDVQKDQREGIANLFGSFNIRHYEEVPIVTMRLAAVKGKTVEEIRAHAGSTIPAWALRREYRSTYRSRLTSTEQIVMGTWRGRVAADTQPIPVSLEKGIAEALKVTLGDELQFEVQGVPLRTQVASIREVDWHRVQPNFFVVFPEGVLESAPQFYALVTRTDSTRVSAGVQRALVERFPNVSMIDLTLVLDTLDSILSRVADAIRFVALFTILTGLAVLVSAVLSGRSQRVKESILLRTLGAPRSQIVCAIVAEYLFLAAISCVTGAVLAAVASWGLSFYFFGEISSISWAGVVSILAVITGATLLAGVVGCWGIFRRPALEALRAET